MVHSQEEEYYFYKEGMGNHFRTKFKGAKKSYEQEIFNLNQIQGYFQLDAKMKFHDDVKIIGKHEIF